MAYQVQKSYHLIVDGDMSATITSKAQEIQYQDNVGIQLNWTGSPVGTFDVQISQDHREDIEGNIVVAGNWISLPLSPAITASGSGDVAYIDLNQMSAPYVRIVYHRTSGTGTLQAFVTGKAV